MKLEEAKKVLMSLPEYQDLVSKECEAIDTVIAELHAMQNLLDEKNEELDRLQGENDLAKKALIANSYEADERNNLLVKIQELQKENEELSCVKKAIKVYKTNVGTENCQFVLMSESEFLNSFNYKCLLDDYISKDKIKELILKKKQKIQENNEEIEKCRKTIMEEQELKKLQLFTLHKNNDLLELEIKDLFDLLKEE